MGYDLSLGFILTAIWTFCVIVFGLSLLFSRSSNIERPILVGCLTLLTAAIAAILLGNEAKLGLRSHPNAFVSIAILAVLGFAVGRVIDYLLGPALHSIEETEPTLGADLAD